MRRKVANPAIECAKHGTRCECLADHRRDARAKNRSTQQRTRKRASKQGLSYSKSRPPNTVGFGHSTAPGRECETSVVAPREKVAKRFDAVAVAEMMQRDPLSNLMEQQERMATSPLAKLMERMATSPLAKLMEQQDRLAKLLEPASDPLTRLMEQQDRLAKLLEPASDPLTKLMEQQDRLAKLLEPASDPLTKS
jgi:hypothetical protein